MANSDVFRQLKMKPDTQTRVVDIDLVKAVQADVVDQESTERRSRKEPSAAIRDSAKQQQQVQLQ